MISSHNRKTSFITAPCPSPIELLAPARDCETGIAAINCGADAVYIGAEAFGAREAASNSVANIERLAGYAHRYYARVYAALNTLLHDQELPQAEALIRRLWSVGVDALIIQDMGLLELDLPPLPLFASTQTHNTTPEKVRFLEEAGFSRVILARELSLSEIAAIRRATTVPLECFVHGALCVCYSGRCTMSHAIGGRSANRGRCAQPCRRPYDLTDADGTRLIEQKHLLSLRDMDRSDSLIDLISAGISSFKIEGRLKDIPYVVNTVGWYRQKLDALLDGKQRCKASSGKVTLHFAPNPQKTFNRGYTDYGLKGDKGGMASPDTPKSMGEPLGHVTSVGRDFFSIEKEATLANGDGLCFFDGNKTLRGTAVIKVDVDRIYPDRMEGIEKGRLIYRNFDRLFTKLLSGTAATRQVDVNLHVSGNREGILLKITDEDGNEAAESLSGPLDMARESDKGKETILRQLTKLGGTIFYPAGVDVDLDEIPFLPASALNETRRRAVVALMAERERNRPIKEAHREKNSYPYPAERLSFEDNVLNDKAETFYRRHGVKEIERAAESGIGMDGKRVMTTLYCILETMGLCAERKKKKGLKEPLFLVDEEGRRFRLKFDCAACRMEIIFDRDRR